jgi:hypothetical protein
VIYRRDGIRRLRISLNWLLLGFAMISIGLCLLFVDPMQKAKRLVGATNCGEVHPYGVVERPIDQKTIGAKITKHKAVAGLSVTSCLLFARPANRKSRNALRASDFWIAPCWNGTPIRIIGKYLCAVKRRSKKRSS